jgi:tripartite-type tricarboxylate transporter receptor subunit TctC
MLQKRYLKFSIALVLIFSLLVGCAANSDNSDNNAGENADGANQPEQSEQLNYPERPLTAIVPFAAGGGTDAIMRKITPLAEEALGESIVINNKPGATGSVGTQEVYSLAADGYTLLMAAENQNLYRTTGISELSFHNFEPVLLLGRAVPVIVTRPDSKWNTVQELLADAEQNPGQIKVFSTGPVGISGVVTAMLGKEFNKVPYDGAGPGLAGLLGGHVDAGIVDIPAAKEYVAAGKLKVLAVVNDTKLEDYPDWPALGEEMPEYNKYLPWGPYYGVYVKEGTPEEIVNKLTAAFKTAWESEEFQEFMKQNSLVPLGLSGEEAKEFQQTWESNTNWLLYEAGVAEDPSQFGIPKPE